MSAVACLRVVLDVDGTSPRQRALGPIVRKLASAYLETRWTWPREFEPLTDYAFLLQDPRADELNVRELVKLSEELQLKFFGQSNAGKVSLLLLEGSETAARDFALLEGEALAQARSDPSRLPAGSRLAQIFAEDLVTQMTSTAAAPEEVPEPPAVPPHTPAQLFGIYFRMRNVFIGDVVSHVDERSRDRPMVVDGVEHLPKNPEAYDAGCIDAAVELLKDEALRSILYVPLSYDSLVRPSQREAVAARISRLPEARRSQVAAIIYNVPRAPAFGVVTQIRTMLNVFNTVDLRIEDPAFEIDKLPAQAVAGVSFALPTGDRRTRMSALRRFVEQRAAYKQRRIWASVTNIRDAQELEACEALGIPFVTGPAICAPQPRPLGGRVIAPESLPVR